MPSHPPMNRSRRPSPRNPPPLITATTLSRKPQAAKSVVSEHRLRNNSRYLGNNKLSQDPIWGFNTFLSHNLSADLYIQAGAILTAGGQADVNGVPAGVVQNNWQGVVGLGTKAWKGASIVGTYSETIYRASNNPHNRSLLLLPQQAF